MRFTPLIAISLSLSACDEYPTPLSGDECKAELYRVATKTDIGDMLFGHAYLDFDKMSPYERTAACQRLANTEATGTSINTSLKSAACYITPLDPKCQQ
jgi:hypothetical protein